MQYNLSEFRELTLYYIFMLYVYDLVFSRFQPMKAVKTMSSQHLWRGLGAGFRIQKQPARSAYPVVEKEPAEDREPVNV